MYVQTPTCPSDSCGQWFFSLTSRSKPNTKNKDDIAITAIPGEMRYESNLGKLSSSQSESEDIPAHRLVSSIVGDAVEHGLSVMKLRILPKIDISSSIVDVGKLWEHIPIVGWMIVENKRCGERRIGKHEADQYCFNLPPKSFATRVDSKEHRFQLKALENDVYCFDVTIRLEWL
ncbi:hypothetical protein Tco_0772203 [Tanacetum coccineum]|uniref:Uncharacterized protein n=1 Tax=Tanacetum coccineum TaxID=301880 RepID=A0ABQ4ZIB6_9ASTR